MPDDEMRNRLSENNSYAALKLISRLIEADKRNYWQASDEEIQKLTEAYIDLEGIAEEKNSL